MALKCGQIFFVVFIVAYRYFVWAYDDFGPQIIDSEFETIIEANGNHTIWCQGNQPLQWTIPVPVKGPQELLTTFFNETVEPTNETFQYASRLDIVNISYRYVGFYYCHYDGANPESNTDSAGIYLYVNDDQHLSPITEEDINVIPLVVTQFTTAVIPCKPTSPNVEVELQDAYGDKPRGIHYDPKTGFSFFVSDLSQQGIYICLFSRDLETSDILVHLTIQSSQPISHLYKPYIIDLSEHHTVVGNQLILQCVIKSENSVNFYWTTPNEVIYEYSEGRIAQSQQNKTNDKRIYVNLIVNDTTLEDKGIYTCNVTDRQGHSNFAILNVTIFDLNDYYLELESEPVGIAPIIAASAGDKAVQWSVNVHGHPIPKVTWLDNNNDTIIMNNVDKYEANFNPHTGAALLKIKNIKITDFGNYTLLAVNNKTEKMISIFLNVTDKPTVDLVTEPFYLSNTTITITCNAYAYPEPEFKWEYKKCQTDECPFESVTGTILESQGFQFTSQITLNASNSGFVKCNATNSKGDDENIKGLYITDIENGFNLFDLDSTYIVNDAKKDAIIASNQTLSVTCGASKSNYSDITWFFKDKKLTPDDGYLLEPSITDFSNILKLTIPEVNSSCTGVYSCRVNNQNGEYLYKNISFNVSNPEKPVIRHTNMKEEMEINMHEELNMFCEISGIPKPTLTWYKNGILFQPSEPKRIRVSENNANITILRINETDEAIYKCEARNMLGKMATQQYVKIKNKPQSPMWLLLLVIILGSVCIAAFVLIFIKVRKEKQLQRELKKLGLATFAKGAIENINPELGIDDQAELLPYDQKWEFPIEHLKLGKQLGSGAFGVVMKGEAKNIVEGESVTTVAVKMVKKNTDHTYLRALASELKIMVHLRKHLNVVNLLGACTKNMVKRELLVIVEYCRYGNLQNYLLRNRENYIDQVDPRTGKIDYYIGQEYFDRSYSVSSDRSNTQSPSLKYAALKFSNSGTHPILPAANSMGDYRANATTGASVATEMTTVTQGEDGVMLSNNSVQPEWRSNYRGDYKGSVKPICTSDLLAWAFQVARGMEYLASRKVLHGDLAARNILLADNNIVKICDFGLAKNMYKNDNYKKRGDGPLPVKWMAIESIRDRIFSTQSDIWSYGIVLWEFFSLAKTPYPGMEANERLYQKLVEGYRMEAPQYAPKDIYKMMMDCWAVRPLTRPTFDKLAETIGYLLEESLRKHYIDLNDPYLVMNTQQLQDGQDDYLAMLCPPTFEALSSPQYINDDVGQESLEDSGYLSMKPSTIFSPRADGGQVFDFSTNKRRDISPEDGNTHELLPMLRKVSDSDSETPLQTPTTPSSFSNPSYHIPPNITEETTDDVDRDSGIVKSDDNYINMPGNKSSMKEKNNATNPFANMSSGGGPHYVNSNTKDWESVRV